MCHRQFATIFIEAVTAAKIINKG